MAPKFEAACIAEGARHVIDVRNLGLVGGIELEPRAGAIGRRDWKCTSSAEAGVMVRFTGDIIALSPPLIIEEAQIERIVETIRAALVAVGRRWARRGVVADITHWIDGARVGGAAVVRRRLQSATGR
jgi:beta-alanine--pyruvate transaminase